MKKYILIVLFIIVTSSLFSEEIYKLDNGLTIILKEMHNVPLATFQIWVKTGSIHEVNQPGAGISHFVEHLLFTDTKKRQGTEIAGLMKKYGCDMNGYTSFERTVYHFTLSSESLFKIMPIVKEMIFQPAFKKEQIEKERNVIYKEINMNIDDPKRFFSKLIFSSSYQKAFYKLPVIGYEEFFKDISRNDIISYYKKRYVPDNIAVVVVGDFKTDELKIEIKKHFNSIKRKYLKQVYLHEEPNQTGYREVTKYRKDIKIPKIALAWKTINIRDKDLFSLDVLSMMLERGKGSILKSILKEKNNDVTDVSSFSYTPIKRGIFVVEAELSPEKEPDQIKKKIIKIIHNIKKYITGKNLKKVKQIALRDYYKNKETINSLAGDLGINWVLTGNINFSKYYTDGLRKVSKEEIITVVQKYFSIDNLTFIKLLPEGYKKQIKHSSKKIKSKTYIDKLDNGLRIVLHQNKELPFISISMVFKGGVLFERENKKGLTYFLSEMLLCGTKQYSRNKLLSIIEDSGGNIHSFAGNNSFGINIEIFKEDIDKTLNIIKNILLNCTFPLKEFKRVKMETIQRIKSSQERIFGIGKRILFKEMYENYDYSSLNTGDEKSVGNIKRKDLRNHYKKLAAPENAVLSVSGDFNIKEIKKKLNKVLKDWKNKGSLLKEKPFVMQGLKKEIKEKVNKKQSLFFLCYYGLSVRDNDRIKAELLWNILNGQGSRLFINLREKKELAYFTGMFPFYGLTTGLFVFYIGTTKDNLNLSRKGMFEEVDALIKEGITEKELSAAKKGFLSDKLKIFQANKSISFDYALENLYNNRIIKIKDYKEKINKINLKDMNQFVKRILNKPYKIIILEGE